MSSFLESLVVVLAKAGRSFLGLAPYLFVGVLTGALLRRTAWTRVVRAGCERATFSSILLAAILGVASPLCTYGTVPVMLQLLKDGVPLAPLVTFLATSSLMNPQLFILTMGGLCTELALVRVLAVMVFGLLLGAVMQLLLPRRFSVVNQRALAEAPAVAASSPPARALRGRAAWIDLGLSILRGLEFVGYYFVLGVLLGAIVEVFVPGHWIAHLLGAGPFASVLLASALGVPLYACGGGAIPLVRSLLSQGMSKGAALSFLLVGPATRVTPLLSLAAIMRPRAVALYVAFLFAFALLAGWLYR